MDRLHDFLLHLCCIVRSWLSGFRQGILTMGDIWMDRHLLSTLYSILSTDDGLRTNDLARA
jgi:hypothetical protein